MKVALLGLGTVGQAVYELIAERSRELGEICGQKVSVGAVVVKDRNKVRCVGNGVDVLYDPGVVVEGDYEIIIEAVGGRGEIGDAVARALQRGKTVITANKELIAMDSGELVRAAGAGSRLFCEASVGAGMPVVRSVVDMWGGDRVYKVEGILNGTCNYVLYKMGCGLSFDQGLAEAQRCGYAEADPGDDINGSDSVRKLVIITALGMGIRLGVADVDVTGLYGVGRCDVELGQSMGKDLRYVVRVVRDEAGVWADAGLRYLDRSDPLARVDGVTNCVVVCADNQGQIVLKGDGAGGRQTASGIVSDLTAALRGQSGVLDCLKRVSKGADVVKVKRERDVYVRSVREMSEDAWKRVVSWGISVKACGMVGGLPWVWGRVDDKSDVMRVCQGQAVVIGCDRIQ